MEGKRVQGRKEVQRVEGEQGEAAEEGGGEEEGDDILGFDYE